LIFTGAQLLADVRQVTETMGIRRADLNYALIPFGHSYGLGNLTLPLIARGSPIVCGSAPLPHAVATDFATYRPTVFPGVPAFWRALVAADVPQSAFRSLRVAISAGSPLPAEVARDFAARFPGRLHNFYGSSETGGIAYDRRGAATLEGSVGSAMRGVKLRLVGERLTVSSAAVFTQGNRRRLGGRGCWVTPDRVAVNGRGELTLLGRTGKIVKVGGRRLNLAEVVTRLRRLRGVSEAWVAASETVETTLGAVVISDRPVTELRAELQASLPAWKIPKKWAAVREWPLTERGKIDTRALRQLIFG
jgi:acyl-coenzyme A synthetase/AMP-(fatty) acid ligase